MSQEKDDASGPWKTRIALAAALALAAYAWVSHGRTGTGPAAVAKPPPAPPLPTRLAPDSPGADEAVREAAPVGAAYRRDVDRPRPVQNVAPEAPARDEPAGGPPGSPTSMRRDEKKTLPEIFHMPPGPASAAAPAAAPAPAAPPARPALFTQGFAPFGRLIKCELVNTLDSATARAEPIVGLVTEDLDWNGRVIIPAGTEAFSYARPEAVIDTAGAGRLVDSGEWTLVLPGEGGQNGRELILKARAVDRRESATGPTGRPQSWEAGDGADGLSGRTVSTAGSGEARLFASAAIGGMAQGIAAVAERQQAAPGISGALGATEIAPTLGNAAVAAGGNGAVAVMNEYAGRIRDEISKHAVYVRVDAGKPFYLFVEQTIDPRAAGVGLRLSSPGGTQR
ncbi:MAG TPA: TrbI/VirB10 family protein [Opitutaceae bacterium]|jgi:hypothetical protein